jgi:aquaporin Z
MKSSRVWLAEFFGTFWLVFGGCGSAVLAAIFKAGDAQIGIGLLGVSLAFGLTVLTMAYAIGHISGCHLNPAVTIGLASAGRIGWAKVPGYILAQVLGGVAGGGVLLAIASGKSGFAIDPNAAGAFACNGYDQLSPGGYSLASCAIAEVLLTFMFLLIILGSTDRKVPAGVAPVAIGLGLTLIHLIGIPITNLSVNPARSLGVAAYNPAALQQVWLFWAAPIVGAVMAGGVHRVFFASKENEF